MVIESSLEQDDYFDDDNDFDLIDRCEMLFFNVEIGEMHERDKFHWAEHCHLQKRRGSGAPNTAYALRSKEIEFDFKMNHIKQTIRYEISGMFAPRNSQGVS